MKATSPIPPEEYLGQNLVAVSQLVETKIGHELNLINHRVSWLAASQSFLVLSVITLLPGYSQQSHPAIRIVLMAIPVIGLALCTQVYLSVGAAFKVLREHLLPERGQLVTELNRLTGASFAQLGTDRLTDFFGAIPAKWIPLTFIFSWLGALAIVVWLIQVP